MGLQARTVVAPFLPPPHTLGHPCLPPVPGPAPSYSPAPATLTLTDLLRLLLLSTHARTPGHTGFSTTTTTTPYS